MTTDANGKMYCSFCGKSQDEVFQLIAGPIVFICDECVDLCGHIVQQERDRRAAPVIPKGSLLTCSRGHNWTDETVRIIPARHAADRPIVCCPVCFHDLVCQDLGKFGALFDLTGEYSGRDWPVTTITYPAPAGEAGTAETLGGSVHEHTAAGAPK